MSGRGSAICAFAASAGHSGSHPRPIWNGDLSVGGLSEWTYVQACPGPQPPAGVALVTRPVHPGLNHSLRFTVSDASTTVRVYGNRASHFFVMAPE